MEPLSEIDSATIETKLSANFDRLKIGKLESEKMSALLLQAQASSKGFMALTKSDIVNFLIREHKMELSSKELAQLRVDHYDPVRHMNWITTALKTALLTGDLAAVEKLQCEIKGIELSKPTKNSEDSGSSGLDLKQIESVLNRKRLRKSKAANQDQPSQGTTEK